MTTSSDYSWGKQHGPMHAHVQAIFCNQQLLKEFNPWTIGSQIQSLLFNQSVPACGFQSPGLHSGASVSPASPRDSTSHCSSSCATHASLL